MTAVALAHVPVCITAIQTVSISVWAGGVGLGVCVGGTRAFYSEYVQLPSHLPGAPGSVKL